MIKITDLSYEERLEVEHLGNQFYARHTNHVDSIRKAKGELSVAPSGSDIFHPDLWKAIHWNWFFAEFVVE